MHAANGEALIGWSDQTRTWVSNGRAVCFLHGSGPSKQALRDFARVDREIRSQGA